MKYTLESKSFINMLIVWTDSLPIQLSSGFPHNAKR